jgi:glycerol-3-phosphate dehydrogenase
MVPKTEDGRVIFAIPWQGKVVIGTTDLAASKVELEPGYIDSEIEYLLDHINSYLQTPITRDAILSIFSGLRPLVTGSSSTTSKLSREHHIDASATGLITVAGGKWTTYRRMAQDVLDFAIREKVLPPSACKTREVLLHGAPQGTQASATNLARYGSDAPAILRLIEETPGLGATLDPAFDFTRAEVVYAVRCEMAKTVEDVLSRRSRDLLLVAKAALRAAPAVAALMASELRLPPEWEQQQLAEFQHLAEAYYIAHEHREPTD